MTRHRPSLKPARLPAFTLLELLVSVAVLALIVAVVAQMVANTSLTVGESERRVSTAAQARMILDRLAVDLSRGLWRDGVPSDFIKREGNDEIAFHTTLRGYGPARRELSAVFYETGTEGMVRGVRALDWDQMRFAPNPFPTLTAANSEIQVMGDLVFRMEFAVLNSEGELVADPESVPGNNQAILVGLALIDPSTLTALGQGIREELAPLLPDARDGQTFAELWNPVIEGGGFDGVAPRAASGVRVYERFYPLANR